MNKNTNTDDLFDKIITQEKTAKAFGFYWKNIDQIVKQIESECFEVKEAYLKNNLEHLKEEIGDLIHATLSLCIFLDQEPLETLRKSFKKFQVRYNAMVDFVNQDGLDNLHNKPMEVLLSYWERAKQSTKQDELC